MRKMVMFTMYIHMLFHKFLLTREKFKPQCHKQTEYNRVNKAHISGRLENSEFCRA